ncbi:unnamed protein product [Acanthoscelides obtectus]|uniref:Uncharacterized protein n=1 Tax=Acanthoscelides obtectus TaxID=200917 RepID=A0A9P0P8V5_ACAOB|nr:unnamed protein product [Acanthoscelides obtectus]CAK1624792.1 hypothetical protein AOBTE_LOCUS2766 [Acanthoscelides obtectus]
MTVSEVAIATYGTDPETNAYYSRLPIFNWHFLDCKINMC